MPVMSPSLALVKDTLNAVREKELEALSVLARYLSCLPWVLGQFLGHRAAVRSPPQDQTANGRVWSDQEQPK